MKKRVFFAIIGLVVIVAVLAGIKALQIRDMAEQGKKFVPPPETVTTFLVRGESWDTSLSAVGTLSAVQGVTVAAEMPGKVTRIAFEAGRPVQKGELLVAQDTSSEKAQLAGALAQAELARSTLERTERLLPERIASPADHESALAAREQALAQAASLRAVMEKKEIRAPFGGRLGIRQVNLGQMLREGDPVVTLQALAPIYVDFSLPQQQIGALSLDLPVKVMVDALPGLEVAGRVTALNPLIDAQTRNIRVQATLANRDEKLRPGMFVNVALGLPARQRVLAIPATAVLYAPYGDSVFVVEDDRKGKGGKVLRQQFVRLGEKRGDFVAVAAGLKEREVVVSTGVFKLMNGQAVIPDNRLSPPFKLTPRPENS